MAIGISYASLMDYGHWGSIQETIERETQEISSTCHSDHNELAELYVSRGESYLLDAQYDRAFEDFQAANSHLKHCQNTDKTFLIGFRSILGEVVCYDNLGMKDQAEQSLEQLAAIVDQIGCNDCKEHRPCKDIVVPSDNKFHFHDLTSRTINNLHVFDEIVPCKHKKDKKGNQQSQGSQDNYDDIVGPNQSEPGWCEEMITGVGRAMDAIACLAPNYGVKVALIGVIETLIQRGVKCCQTGDFWKACVAPIVRKWQQWRSNKERHIYPNDQNLPLYK